MTRALLLIVVGVLYILHQDFWFWREARPLALGFIPIGLFYHACYTVFIAAVMWLLVKHAWPSHLEEEGEREQRPGDGLMERGGEETPHQGGHGPLASPPNRPVAFSGEGSEH